MNIAFDAGMVNINISTMYLHA